MAMCSVPHDYGDFLAGDLEWPLLLDLPAGELLRLQGSALMHQSCHSCPVILELFLPQQGNVHRADLKRRSIGHGLT